MRNRWLVALWVVSGVGVVASIGGAYALVGALPRSRTEAGYAGVDWAWVNIIQVLWLPAAVTVLISAVLGLLVYYAAGFRTRT